jgi:3-phenylpropionate/trans-cinnamate dioxygenase ferredoxin subunit
MDYVTVGRVGDIEEGKGRTFEAAGRKLAVVLAGGTYYALDDLCSHAEASLGEGRVEEGQVECPRHGALFDLATGAAASLPAVKPVGSHPVRVSGDEIQVGVE